MSAESACHRGRTVLSSKWLPGGLPTWGGGVHARLQWCVPGPLGRKVPMSSGVPGSAFGLAAGPSGGAGVPLVVLFERDDTVAVPLLTQLRLAGYDVRAARTPVELFDTLRKHAVALIL